jgi:2-keto-4-pentenoate hydratase/2-oxohepta-3-ene-1,7-dioic acid hydratase in catechol pathway
MAIPSYEHPILLTFFIYLSINKNSRDRLPILFYKPVTSLIGPLATIVIPKVAQPSKDHLPDYEVELVIVIGKAAKNVSEADALDYVLGYTGANDVRCS